MKKSFVVTVEDSNPVLFDGATDTILHAIQDFTIFDAVAVKESPK